MTGLDFSMILGTGEITDSLGDVTIGRVGVYLTGVINTPLSSWPSPFVPGLPIVFPATKPQSDPCVVPGDATARPRNCTKSGGFVPVAV